MVRSPRPRVLLVDDRNENRYVLSRILLKAGFSIEECSTGMQALDSVRSLPDLVILDIKLPDISGYDICRDIKSDPATRDVPVLLTSAMLEPQNAPSLMARAGADGVLLHPLDPEQVMAKVSNLLKRYSKPTGTIGEAS
jgi:two-component system, NtrC family, sensor kinase